MSIIPKRSGTADNYNKLLMLNKKYELSNNI